MKLNVKRFKEFLKFRDWNQSDFAKATGYSRAYICLLIKGSRIAPAKVLDKFSEVTALPLTELFIVNKKKN